MWLYFQVHSKLSHYPVIPYELHEDGVVRDHEYFNYASKLR